MPIILTHRKFLLKLFFYIGVNVLLTFVLLRSNDLFKEHLKLKLRTVWVFVLMFSHLRNSGVPSSGIQLLSPVSDARLFRTLCWSSNFLPLKTRQSCHHETSGTNKLSSDVASHPTWTNARDSQLVILPHWGRVTQICVFTLQLCKTDAANLRF